MEINHSRQLTALLMTANNKTKNYIHRKQKRQTRKTDPANKTIKVWFGIPFTTSGQQMERVLFSQPREPTGGLASTKYCLLTEADACEHGK